MDRSEIFEGLRNDHRKVLEQLAILDWAVAALPRPSDPAWPGREVEEILAMLARQFRTHMAAEDEIIYPALAETLPEAGSNLEPLRAEHHTLRMMLRDLERELRKPASETRNEQIGVLLRDLCDLLRIHIRKEDAIVFALAERALTQTEVESIAARMNRGAAEPVRRTRKSGTAKGASR